MCGQTRLFDLPTAHRLRGRFPMDANVRYRYRVGVCIIIFILGITPLVAFWLIPLVAGWLR